MKKNKIMSIGLFAIISLSLIPMMFKDVYAQEVPIYEVTTDTSGNNINSVNYQLICERVTPTSALIGEEFNRVSILLRKISGAPTGLAYIGVWNSTTTGTTLTPTDSNYLKLFGTIDVATIPTSSTRFNFTQTESWTIGENNCIGVYYNGGDGTNSISARHTNDAFDGTNTLRAGYTASGGTGWDGAITGTNTDVTMTLVEVSISGGTTGGIDCNDPANANILICRIATETGGQIGGLGGILDSGLFNLFTNSGLIDGSDTDPKTNGIGYFITITGFGVMTAMFFIATKGRLQDVPTFVWMLSAIALLGAITAIGWLEPTFLIIGIIVIIALSAMQVRNSIDRGLDFGGSGRF